jgi:hypothetical protein
MKRVKGRKGKDGKNDFSWSLCISFLFCFLKNYILHIADNCEEREIKALGGK